MARPKGSGKNRAPNGDSGRRVGRNGYDGEDLKRIVTNIEMELAGIDELHAGIAGDVARHRAEIGEQYGDAKILGIPVKALKAAVKMRRLEKKLEQVERDELDHVRHVLGDLMGTPLGDWVAEPRAMVDPARAITDNPAY